MRSIAIAPPLARILGCLLALALMAACQPLREPPALSVTLTKPQDQAQVHWEGANIIVDLFSPSGIGAAQITWPDELEADALLLRLHLNGLEGLQITGGAQQAALAVENAPPYTVRAEGGAADSTALDIEVQRSEGTFDVRVGSTWLQSESLEVQWVDFYR